ncbi:MAG: hypothetical protein K8M05_32190, partial [Deltaproteobacteria bacterium]|nr:hypothetical protein [Kofleriaceae bacterium]
MHARAVLLALLSLGMASCTVDPTVYGPDDGGGDDDAAVVIGDAPVDGPDFVVRYLAPSEAHAGTTSWTISENTTLGTTSLTATPALPAGVTFTTAAQLDTGAPEVAVLRVDAFTLGAGLTLLARGDRPLVIIAGGDVDIAGVIDGGSTVQFRGAGGSPHGMGAGAGTAGVTSGTSDAGGGGAGHATSGARGGSCNGILGGAGGAFHGEAPP